MSINSKEKLLDAAIMIPVIYVLLLVPLFVIPRMFSSWVVPFDTDPIGFFMTFGAFLMVAVLGLWLEILFLGQAKRFSNECVRKVLSRKAEK